MDKRKITVDIAGNPLTIVTDEPDEFVQLLTDTISSRISEMTKSSFRASSLDAALLLAMDYLGDKLKAESKVRSLESRLSLCELNLNKALEKNESDAPSDNGDGSPSSDDAAVEEVMSNDHETRVHALEKYLDSKDKKSSGGKTREEKIKYIESLLKSNDNK
jgi:cell division protein ZapA (FtsZ GTPase activity inhibitor)